jgi:hypothetical protein
LNSTYQAKWNGPYIKLKSSVKIIPSLKLAADVNYNQVNYGGKGDWNLIEDLQHPVSYRHSAKGYGVNAGAKLIYDITNHVAVNIGYTYFSWETGTGNDQLYLTSGQTDKTQLNGVFRKGFEVVGGMELSL